MIDHQSSLSPNNDEEKSTKNSRRCLTSSILPSKVCSSRHGPSESYMYQSPHTFISSWFHPKFHLTSTSTHGTSPNKTFPDSSSTSLKHRLSSLISNAQPLMLDGVGVSHTTPSFPSTFQKLAVMFSMTSTFLPQVFRNWEEK